MNENLTAEAFNTWPKEKKEFWIKSITDVLEMPDGKVWLKSENNRFAVTYEKGSCEGIFNNILAKDIIDVWLWLNEERQKEKNNMANLSESEKHQLTISKLTDEGMLPTN